MQLGGSPLQSWGEHSDFTDRDTVAHPTRSALIGMIASALGIPREQAVTDPGSGSPTLFGRLGGLRFTIRHDRPGTRLRDFHTVGGGFPAHRTVPTAKGGRRGAGAATITSHRHYLADAVFTVAVTAPNDASLPARCAQALAVPRWPLHLGRRSCPPGAPLLLRTEVADPVTELLCHVPLARPLPTALSRTAGGAPGAGQEEADGSDGDHEGEGAPATVTVRFTADAPFPPGFPTSASSEIPATTLNDEPVRLTPRDRSYSSRPSYTANCRLPADLCNGYGPAYLDALLTYLQATTTPSTPPERSDP